MALSKTHKRRLLKLATFLDELPENRFNYRHWVDKDTWKGKPDLSCGTTACALGWATTIPEFRNLGLRLCRDEIDIGAVEGKLLNKRTRIRETFENAAERIFGLEYDEAHFLFLGFFNGLKTKDNILYFKGPKEVASAKEVAQHIRQFVYLKEKGIF
jgi:hypothetical protein